MNRTALVLVASLFVAVTGCSSESDEASTESQDRQTLHGRLDLGGDRDGDGIHTKTGGSANVAGLHVVAHKLGKKGQASVGDIDAEVAEDGSFDLKLPRGARYVFEVERAGESVAHFGWNAKRAGDRAIDTAGRAVAKANVLAIASTTKGKAAVSLGRVKVVDNGAIAENSPSDSFDESDTTGIDLDANWFVSAHGTLVSADDALAEAAEALELAHEALAMAEDALEEAQDALDEAQGTLDRYGYDVDGDE